MRKSRHSISDLSGPYHRFKGCAPTSDGRAIRFKYPNGVHYTVPSEYLAGWYSAPDLILRDGAWRHHETETIPEIEHWQNHWRQFRAPRGQDTPRVIRLRRLGWNLLRKDFLSVLVYMSTGKAHFVQPCHVLIDCEPDYEHFGGFTPESRRWHSRIYPRFAAKIRREMTPQALWVKNLGAFSRARIEQCGNSVSFIMTCGEEYSIPARLFSLLYEYNSELGHRLPIWGTCNEKSKSGHSSHVARKVKIHENRRHAHVSIGDVWEICFTAELILALADHRYQGRIELRI